MLPLDPVKTETSPREVIARDFKSLRGGLPISGGWGYTKDDACVIQKNDPLVNPNMPFNGVEIEYIFVEKRIYEEMIIFRPEGHQFAGIEWKLIKQSTIREEGKIYDKLTFEIRAFEAKTFSKLKEEFEGPNGFRSKDFDLKAHLKKREENVKKFIRDFWFDITSFY